MKAIRMAVFAATSIAILFATWQFSVARKTDAGSAVENLGPSAEIESPSALSRDGSLWPLPAPAATLNDTTVLGSWSFDLGTGECDAQGWISNDWTAQLDEFFHVDDFDGLGGGDFGRLVPIEGSQSLWCGVRPDPASHVYCGYVDLPGYGNRCEQGFITASCLNITGDVTIDYLIAFDSEPGYDYTTLQYDRCDDVWIDIEGGLGVWDGVGSGSFSSVIPDSAIDDSLRIRFWFVSDGAWSDEDGLHNSDGAVLLDSLTVSGAGGVVLPTELFEVESPGDIATVSGNWAAWVPPGYGDFSGLFRGIEVVQEDPCVSNLTCLWGFFNGSTYDYGCGGFPEQAAVPYGNERSQYLNNDIWSPWMPLAGSGAGVELHFDVYRDLPLDPLVFYKWYARTLVDGCPDGWSSRTCCYFGPDKAWLRVVQPFGDFLRANSTAVQVGLAVVDYCPWFCGNYGTGQCHTHSPLFDNVEVIRIAYNGPQWSVRNIDLFQDNFAADGTTTGTVRVDAAIDIVFSSSLNIVPADSSTIRVSNPDVGLAADAYTGFGTAVYMYAAVWPQNQPGKSGNAFSEDSFRWPVVDSLTHNGDTWYCLRMDTSFTNGNDRTGPSFDAFCIDLNDSLFTPGDTICFVFAATTAAPQSITNYYSEFTGATTDLAHALDNPMEMTCLPTGGRDILYVDKFDGRGAQPFFDTAFDILGIADRVDRYDVRGPRSTVGNGPGSRVVNVSQQLLSNYTAILWNSGDLEDGLIGDGTTNIEKSDDAGMLLAFLNGLTVPGGLYISGDNVAEEWPLYSGSAIPLRDIYIPHTLINGDHVASGQPLSPIVAGEAGGCFTGDTFVVYGGCPTLSAFDVLAPAGASTLEASYTSVGSGAGAIVAQSTINPQTQPVGVVLSGFSYHNIRDLDEGGIPARADHLRDILTWLGTSVPVPTPAGGPEYRTELAQNYPNPFNPTTAIEFSLSERAPVTLRVYNVRGQLIKTLVNEERAPGVIHRIEWDGRNDAGQSVASGVYFYRLVTKGFTQTKKMVMLK